jgi:hypothetical protein
MGDPIRSLLNLLMLNQTVKQNSVCKSKGKKNYLRRGICYKPDGSIAGGKKSKNIIKKTNKHNKSKKSKLNKTKKH